MNDVKVKSDDKRIVLTITLDKGSVDTEYIVDVMEFIRMESLAHQVNFDEAILGVEKEIKKSWSEKYGKEVLAKAGHDSRR